MPAHIILEWGMQGWVYDIIDALYTCDFFVQQFLHGARAQSVLYTYDGGAGAIVIKSKETF